MVKIPIEIDGINRKIFSENFQYLYTQKQSAPKGNKMQTSHASG